jgi:4-oxalocrotonate tautomerase
MMKWSTSTNLCRHRIEEKPSSIFAPRHERKSNMPLVSIKLVEAVFATEERSMVNKPSDVIVESGGSEAFRKVTWLLVEERHVDSWRMGGPLTDPESLKQSLADFKAIYETINGEATARAEKANAAPLRSIW